MTDKDSEYRELCETLKRRAGKYRKRHKMPCPDYRGREPERCIACAIDAAHDAIDSLLAERDALRAENAELRTALESIRPQL